MTYDPSGDLKRLTKRRTQTVLKVAKQGAPDNVSGPLVLALYSRETNCRNICGGGYFDDGGFVPTYQDHGLAQISELYWEAWLKNHKGCVEGTYSATQPHCLSKPRLVPRLTDQTEFVCAHLDGNIVQARKAGAKDPKAVGVAAYNCGNYNALRGEQIYDDPDHYTTGKNYSQDILNRERAIRRWLTRHEWT
jgi:hypothetical protein